MKEDKIGKTKRICARLKGGLGNQLFIYAAARRLAQMNQAELWLDTSSGFKQDVFGRKCVLGEFNVSAQTAPVGSFYVSTSRIRRRLTRWFNRRQPFARRRYVEQVTPEFIPELLSLTVRGDVYLDGYWQSEDYFKDIEDVIRRDLSFRCKLDDENATWLNRIASVSAVAVHCRRKEISDPLSARYYREALRLIGLSVPNPEIFVFSDDPVWARENIRLSIPVHHIDRNRGADAGIFDFRLMSACKYFIIASSSFSWWAAWLGEYAAKEIIAPVPHGSWGMGRMLPVKWRLLPYLTDGSDD